MLTEPCFNLNWSLKSSSSSCALKYLITVAETLDRNCTAN